MRRFAGLLSVLFAATLLLTSSRPVGAITVGPQSSSSSSSPDIIITSIVADSTLQDLEIYNQSDTPINLSNWSFKFTIKDSGACSSELTSGAISFPSQWILSKNYLLFENNGSDSSADIFNDSGFASSCSSPWLSSVTIYDGSTAEQMVDIPSDTLTGGNIAQHHQRTNSSSSNRTITGNFSTDYKVSSISSSTSLFSDPLYLPPDDNSGLQILEILPNSQDCPPLDTDLTCGDYVKLYNPTSQTINLALYRLRVGYAGQSTSVTNTFTWGQSVDPTTDELDLPSHSYFMLSARNDGQPLSITDGGDYVWLEDAYGVQVYQPVIQYPDASSTTKVGWSWAYDGANWQWSSSPQPNGPNYFPPVSDSSSSGSSSSLAACAANQYRNPATNHCKLTATSSSSLVPCNANQVRSPDTNRCKSIAAASSGPAPCQPGWERNPATNRCRKVSSSGLANVVDIASAVKPSNSQWWLAGGALALAAGYGIYEWRQEIRLNFEKIILRHKSRK